MLIEPAFVVSFPLKTADSLRWYLVSVNEPALIALVDVKEAVGLLPASRLLLYSYQGKH